MKLLIYLLQLSAIYAKDEQKSRNISATSFREKYSKQELNLGSWTKLVSALIIWAIPAYS